MLNLHTSIMEFVIVHPPKCLSNENVFHVEREFWDDLSQIMYDGEREVAWLEHLDDFHALMEDMEYFIETEVCLLLSHTLRNHLSKWCGTLPHNYVHLFKQFNDLIESIFYHFDP